MVSILPRDGEPEEEEEGGEEDSGEVRVEVGGEEGGRAPTRNC